MKSFDQIKSELKENKQRNIKVTKGDKTRMLRKQELSTYLQMGWKQVKEESVEEKVSYKDMHSYSVIFRNKSGKVESEVRAGSKEKAEKQAKIRNKKVKPSDGAWEVIRTANESLEENFAVHKNGKPLKIKGKEVTATSKAAAEKAIDTMKKQPFNKDAKFTIVQTQSDSKGSRKPYLRKNYGGSTSSMPSWRYAERGEGVDVKYRKPTAAEIEADKKKDRRGKSRPSASHKSIRNKLYKNAMGGLRESRK